MIEINFQGCGVKLMLIDAAILTFDVSTRANPKDKKRISLHSDADHYMLADLGIKAIEIAWLMDIPKPDQD